LSSIEYGSSVIKKSLNQTILLIFFKLCYIHMIVSDCET